MERSDRECEHEFIIAATCDECARYITERRAIRKRTRRRRVPPLNACVICGSNPKRTWSTAYQCPSCLAERGRNV